MKFDDAMKLAKKGNRVRCDGYMSPGWAVAWVPKARSFFNVNPHTGGTYLFIPDDRDLDGDWDTQPKNLWMPLRGVATL